jgi:HPt (histidine-containing phosphotransfer) domain-containing protein
MSTGDPELDRVIAELQEVFRARTASEIPIIECRFAALRAGAAPRAEAEALRRIVHQMAGSAGSFGFHAVGEAAAPVEKAIAAALEGDDADIAEAAAAWEGLIAALLAACRALG